LLAVLYSRKKKPGKWAAWLVLMLVVASVGMSLTACGKGSSGNQQPATNNGGGNSNGPTTNPGDHPNPTSTPTPPPGIACPTPEPGTGTLIPSMSGLPTGTPDVNPTNTPAIFRNGNYERNKAIDFARDNKVSYQNSEIVSREPTDCANFVSYALRAGGLLEIGDWQPGRTEWVSAPELFTFLEGKGFTGSEIFYNTWDVEGSVTTFLKLRDNHPNSQKAEKQKIDHYWKDYLSSIQSARPGDLVFYEDYRRIGWTHVGIITEDWQTPTHYSYGTVLDPDPNEPRIIDHSGPEEIPASMLPRSIGDTSGNIYRVQVLFGP